MRIEMHHVNLTAPDPSAMAVFYRDVLGLHDVSESWGRENRIPEQYGSPLPPLDKMPVSTAATIREMRDHAAGGFALRLYAQERRRTSRPAGARGTSG